MKNCSPWEGVMLEKLVEECPLWEGPHTGTGEGCGETFPVKEGEAETTHDELTINSHSPCTTGDDKVEQLGVKLNLRRKVR